jgi:hypothetical protein
MKLPNLRRQHRRRNSLQGDEPLSGWAGFRLGLTYASIRGCRQQAIEVLTRFAQTPPRGRYWTASHLLLVILQATRSQWHVEWSKKRVMDAEGWTESTYQEALASFREYDADIILAEDGSLDA